VRLSQIASAAAFAAILSATVPASGQPATTVDAAYVAAFYADLATDQDLFREHIEGFTGALSGVIWDVTKEHFGTLLGDSAFATYVFERLPSSLSPTDADDMLVAVLGWGSVAAHGVIRLSPEEQEASIRISSDLYGWFRENDPAACATMQLAATAIIGPGQAITPGLVDAARSMAGPEFAFYEAQGPDYLDRSLAAFVAAVTAEIHDSPAPRRLGSGPIASAALVAYEGAVIARIQSAPNAMAIGRAMMALAAATEIPDPAALCDGVVISMAALSDLSPTERSTAILGLLVGTVDPEALERALGFR
jgi:hypothetical protein